MKIFVLTVGALVYFLAGARAQQNCTALALAGNCSFYDCLSNKFRCSVYDYPVAYGRKYCLKFEEEQNCFTSTVSNYLFVYQADFGIFIGKSLDQECQDLSYECYYY